MDVITSAFAKAGLVYPEARLIGVTGMTFIALEMIQPSMMYTADGRRKPYGAGPGQTMTPALGVSVAVGALAAFYF